jgi:hypothetical protein
VSTLVIPPTDEPPWPSLGGLVAERMEQLLVHGPGDLLGQPYRVDAEFRAILERAYQVYPRGHPREGRRRFGTVVLMLRKGSAKSERAGALAAVELDPDGPVRCDGFRRVGSRWEPVGRPVTDPYIPILAFTGKQAEDTAYAALYQMLSRGPEADRFDIGLERIMRVAGDGRAEALSNAPDSRDGARTTFQIKEETHRWVLARQREAHQATRANLAKRPMADPWEAHLTTMYAPGEGSVAESLHEEARKLTPDQARSGRLFLLYRWADTRIRIRREDGSLDRDALVEAIVDASGPVVASWSDPALIAENFTGPDADPEYAERVWLNRRKPRGVSAFDVGRWRELARPDHDVPPGAAITLGFDGARTDDHAALVACEIATGQLWPVGVWDPAEYGGEVPGGLVDVAVDAAFARWRVVRMYVDPPYWRDEVAAWQGRYGDKVVLKWETWRSRVMGFACRSFATAITQGQLGHPADERLTAAIGHCHRREITERDDKGERLWTVRKEREGSSLKIDAAVAAILAWEARMDAVAAGALAVEEQPVYFYASA